MSTEKKETLPSGFDVDVRNKYLAIIDEWQHFWMDEPDGYHRRAVGVDANMRYDLAQRLAERESPPKDRASTPTPFDEELKIKDFQNEAYKRAKSREGAEHGAGVWDFMAGHDWTVQAIRNDPTLLTLTAESGSTKSREELEAEAKRLVNKLAETPEQMAAKVLAKFKESGDEV